MTEIEKKRCPNSVRFIFCGKHPLSSETSPARFRARQASPALRRGALTWRDGAPPAVLAFRRQTADESVLCVANLSDQPQAHGFGRIRAHDKLDQVWDDVWLPPYAAYWLEEA